MVSDKLKILDNPDLRNPRLLMGFTGWMDGGEVSTGTMKYLTDKLHARKFAEINPEGFYIYNFPGSMEMTALFRPHTRIRAGLITSFDVPRNEFFYDEQHNLILFSGKEPNLQWEEFAECVFSLCSWFRVNMAYFIGSVAGLVPHTREPRFISSVSDAQLKETLQRFGIRFTDYEGPASFITYLIKNCADRDVKMATIVATIPAYVQGNNPRCIEAVIKRVAGILGLQVELDDLRAIGDEFEKKLSDAVEEQPELVANIRKLEEDYDNEVFNTDMSDLKSWLQQQGINLD